MKKSNEWYREIFENYGDKYDRESYVHGTSGECDFIEEEIGGDRSLRILDIGCGTGRHAIELTGRGYRITGIDLSRSMLDRAEEKAEEKGMKIDFRQMNACDLSFHEEFGLAVMLCEGAFPLMETDEKNYRILEGAYRALKEEGKLIFTTLNGLYPLFHSLKEFHDKGLQESGMTMEENSFDLMTFRDHNVVTVEDREGIRKAVACNERYYVPPEITWQLKSLGFSTVEIFGAKLGAFSREDPLTTEDFEMLVIAKK